MSNKFKIGDLVVVKPHNISLPSFKYQGKMKQYEGRGFRVADYDYEDDAYYLETLRRNESIPYRWHETWLRHVIPCFKPGDVVCMRGETGIPFRIKGYDNIVAIFDFSPDIYYTAEDNSDVWHENELEPYGSFYADEFNDFLTK